MKHLSLAPSISCSRVTRKRWTQLEQRPPTFRKPQSQHSRLYLKNSQPVGHRPSFLYQYPIQSLIISYPSCTNTRSNLIAGYRKTKEFWGPKDGRLPLGMAEYKRSTYRARELPILGHGPKPSAPGGESHVFVPVSFASLYPAKTEGSEKSRGRVSFASLCSASTEGFLRKVVKLRWAVCGIDLCDSCRGRDTAGLCGRPFDKHPL